MTANAVTKIEEERRPANVLEIIDRMSRMPNVSTAKLAEMMELQRQLEAGEAKKRWDSAMNIAQSQMHGIVLDRDNSQTKSKYSSYKELDRVIRPIYLDLGFALSFDTADGGPADHVRVVCDVSNSGHTKRYQVDIPVVTQGPKGGDVMTKTHATMSAQSYGRRALAMMIFNLVPGATWDDDGNAAGGKPATDDPHRILNEQELDQVMQRAARLGVGADKLLKRINAARRDGEELARSIQDIKAGELPVLDQAFKAYESELKKRGNA